MIGEIIFLALLSPMPDGYLPADGRCLPIAKYQDLADILHTGDYWPYGKCGNDGFNLPNFGGKQIKARRSSIPATPVIKVR